MNKHTPGPWFLSNGKNYVRKAMPNAIGDPQDFNVCEVNCNVGNPQFEANARLIVVAPNMRKALEDIKAHERAKGQTKMDYEVWTIANDAIKESS